MEERLTQAKSEGAGYAVGYLSCHTIRVIFKFLSPGLILAADHSASAAQCKLEPLLLYLPLLIAATTFPRTPPCKLLHVPSCFPPPSKIH